MSLLITCPDFKTVRHCSWRRSCAFKIFNPLGMHWGCQKMIHVSASSRQPACLPWTMECLIHEHSILLGMAIDNTTAHTYSSMANLYLTFCKIHQLPVDPTPETLSYYITFQSTHINPNSVESYLSGICSNLEPFFPDIRANRATVLVKCTLKGTCPGNSTILLQ